MEELLKLFMRGAAQQVYAVTARRGDDYAALTATSVTSISLRPPLMMVSVSRDSRNYPVIASADHFIISMLGSDGADVSARLAEPADARAKLEAVGYRETEWGPVVSRSRGYLALRRFALYGAGDHDIVLGEVVGGEPPAGGCPLVHYDRGYTTVSSCPGARPDRRARDMQRGGNRVQLKSMRPITSDVEIAFGPIPSRRLGMSLGVNNIPPKHCTYNCVYCQVGRGAPLGAARREFYGPEEVLESVRRRLELVTSRGERVDYATFVPDGEPTLDLNLGREIEMIRGLGVRVAVITNSSLMWDESVRSELSAADYVSFKVDAVTERIWRFVDRPSRGLSLDAIMDGILRFASLFGGHLASETMLTSGVDYGDEAGLIASYLGTVSGLRDAYVSVPTRPPAEPWVGPPDHGVVVYFLARFREVLGDRAKPLDFPERGPFGHTGDARSDILSAAEVHPLGEGAVAQILRDDGAGEDALRGLLESGDLREIEYGGARFYVSRDAVRRDRSLYH